MHSSFDRRVVPDAVFALVRACQQRGAGNVSPWRAAMCVVTGFMALGCGGAGHDGASRGDGSAAVLPGMDAGLVDVVGSDGSGLDAPVLTSQDSASQFTCVGHVTWPAPAAATETLTLHVLDLQGMAPLPGVTARACGHGDVPCDHPFSSGTTDALGVVPLTFPTGTTGFDGYFELTGGSVMPTRVFAVPPEVVSAAMTTVLAVTQQEFNLLAAIARVTPDPARGHLATVLEDCDEHAAAGLALTVAPSPPDATPFYIAGVVPNTHADHTDATGIAGVLSLPPGTYALTSAVAGVHVGAASVNVRAGFLTQFGLPPTP